MKNILKKFLTIVSVFILAATIIPYASAFDSVNAVADDSTCATLTLGNNRWVTKGAGKYYDSEKDAIYEVNSSAPTGTLIGKYQLTFDYSVLNVTGNKNAHYLGKVWNRAGDTSYPALLWILESEVVVDTTSCKASFFVDIPDTEFIIKQSDVFTLVEVNKSAGMPDKIVAETDYLISCKLDSSVINVKDLNSKFPDAGGETEGDKPVIAYEGETTLDFFIGDCVPLPLVKANDMTDGDVLVKRTWSDGAYDENYKLLPGTHTLTLSATNKAGKTSEVIISVNVTEQD